MYCQRSHQWFRQPLKRRWRCLLVPHLAWVLIIRAVGCFAVHEMVLNVWEAVSKELMWIDDWWLPKKGTAGLTITSISPTGCVREVLEFGSFHHSETAYYDDAVAAGGASKQKSEMIRTLVGSTTYENILYTRFGGMTPIFNRSIVTKSMYRSTTSMDLECTPALCFHGENRIWGVVVLVATIFWFKSLHWRWFTCLLQSLFVFKSFVSLPLGLRLTKWARQKSSPRYDSYSCSQIKNISGGCLGLLFWGIKTANFVPIK
jgi:hypothetical protein